MSDIEIFVADLKAFHNNSSHGVWIDATLDPEIIKEEIRNMLRDSPFEGADEYEVQIYEGFGSYAISKSATLEIIHATACFIEKYPNFGAGLLSCLNGHLEEAENTVINNYAGHHNSLADYAEKYTRENYDIPSYLDNCIDWEKKARDWKYGGGYILVEDDSGVHIFAK